MIHRLFCWSVVAVLLLCCGVNDGQSAQERPANTSVKPSSAEPRPGNCLTEDEAELARLVNKWRQDNGLPPIRVTGSLYKVAKWHVIDLALFAPHRDKADSRGMPCDLHSWSDKGEGRGGWKPVCYTSDHYYARHMWYKPKEIADYSGISYENTYWTSAPLSPLMVISCWDSRSGEKELILEQRDWKNSRWKAMGVGIYGNYASVWIGDKADHEDEMVKCEGVQEEDGGGGSKSVEKEKNKEGDREKKDKERKPLIVM